MRLLNQLIIILFVNLGKIQLIRIFQIISSNRQLRPIIFPAVRQIIILHFLLILRNNSSNFIRSFIFINLNFHFFPLNNHLFLAALQRLFPALSDPSSLLNFLLSRTRFIHVHSNFFSHNKRKHPCLSHQVLQRPFFFNRFLFFFFFFFQLQFQFFLPLFQLLKLFFLPPPVNCHLLVKSLSPKLVLFLDFLRLQVLFSHLFLTVICKFFTVLLDVLSRF